MVSCLSTRRRRRREADPEKRDRFGGRAGAHLNLGFEWRPVSVKATYQDSGKPSV